MLRLNKDLLPEFDFLDFGIVEDCRNYRIWSNDELLGQFYCSGAGAYFMFGDRFVRIVKTEHGLKDSEYRLIDNENGSELGRYKIPGWFGGLTPLGEMIYRGKVFKCAKLKPALKANMLKPSTWGHYAVRVFGNEESVTYELKLKLSMFGLNSRELSPFQGTIQLTGENMFLLFGGLFLLEHVFNHDDNLADS
jgi:hypothetical protein